MHWDKQGDFHAGEGGGGGTTYDGVYGEAPSDRSTFFIL